jgi:ribosomal protein S18 acetylase RimI-like enzyme
VIPSILLEEIEAAAYRSWPAAEVVEYDGWELRFGNGFSRRANSVYPANSSALDHGEKLQWCRQWYQRRGLDLVVRQTMLTEPGLDQVLADRGFREEGRTNVLVADLTGHQRGGAVITESPTTEWWDATAGLWGIDSGRMGAWRAIVDRIDLPAGFGSLSLDDRTIAVGFAVADGSWLGLFEIIVADDYRRQGIGQSLTRSLMAWGRGTGAQRAYLQVVAENAPAIAMYDKVGFGHAYNYWYRRAPHDEV